MRAGAKNTGLKARHYTSEGETQEHSHEWLGHEKMPQDAGLKVGRY